MLNASPVPFLFKKWRLKELTLLAQGDKSRKQQKQDSHVRLVILVGTHLSGDKPWIKGILGPISLAML